MIKALLFMAFIFVLGSCASIKSGDYVEIHSGDTLASLATEYGTTKSEILVANKGKEFSPGEWFFIPHSSGIAQLLREKGKPPVKGLSKQAVYHGKFLWPVPSTTVISSPFGKRRGRMHEGIDIPAPRGTTIVASEDGIVYFAGRMPQYGNIVIIDHKNGYLTVYGHNKTNLVKRKQKVHRGQKIARVGNTGRSRGPHLHFEVRNGEKAVDPMDYLSASRRIIAQESVTSD
jgi:murein DD-endopeptidase MepM/ murein hydrolase activator NlpD